uniref:Uncharacterized protein n=1 Tax=Rangifer tarandus platyrhynchus TaxID=3082113 RepID=A0ACB0ECM7_RANTA|nr:unnamed protein product [Rangifer tarandus platyrhynchus]
MIQDRCELCAEKTCLASQSEALAVPLCQPWRTPPLPHRRDPSKQPQPPPVGEHVTPEQELSHIHDLIKA